MLDADEKTLTDCYERWVEDSLQEGTKREKVWSEAVAAGFAEFAEGIKAKLGVKAKYRLVSSKPVGAAYALQEPTVPYNINFGGEMDILKAENRSLWEIFTDI